MRFSYPETGGISQSLRAVGKPRNLHKPKNTPGLGSNPGFPIVRRPRFHGATARPHSQLHKQGTKKSAPCHMLSTRICVIAGVDDRRISHLELPPIKNLTENISEEVTG